jgi:hypothetical protein
MPRAAHPSITNNNYQFTNNNSYGLSTAECASKGVDFMKRRVDESGLIFGVIRGRTPNSRERVL